MKYARKRNNRERLDNNIYNKSGESERNVENDRKRERLDGV